MIHTVMNQKRGSTDTICTRQLEIIEKPNNITENLSKSETPVKSRFSNFLNFCKSSIHKTLVP